MRCAVLVLVTLAASCGREKPAEPVASPAPPPSPQGVPESLAMGGAKSVTRFFVTSKGLGRGGDVGGVEGAEGHWQALAKAEGSGDHLWRAYLSTSPTGAQPGVNARDRIGKGPWYNAEGSLVAANVDALHGNANRVDKQT